MVGLQYPVECPELVLPDDFAKLGEQLLVLVVNRWRQALELHRRGNDLDLKQLEELPLSYVVALRLDLLLQPTPDKACELLACGFQGAELLDHICRGVRGEGNEFLPGCFRLLEIPHGCRPLRVKFLESGEEAARTVPAD